MADKVTGERSRYSTVEVWPDLYESTNVEREGVVRGLCITPSLFLSPLCRQIFWSVHVELF